MAMTVLPSFVVMNIGSRYLSVTENLPAGLLPSVSGFLKFDEEDIWSPRVKFAVDDAETADRGLVHIRSCYNNKYLVATRAFNDWPSLWIVASAEKPDEDISKPSCTLFRPCFMHNQGVLFDHVQSQLTIEVSIPVGSANPSDRDYGLWLSSTPSRIFGITDWETLVKLPSQVTFKYQEEEDGKYLCSRAISGRQHLRFESGLDVGEPVAAHELYPANNGHYRIKSVTHDRFWRRNPVDNWIVADTDINDNSRDAWFSIVKISDKVIAIRNLGNNNFCGQHTLGTTISDSLRAIYTTMSNPTKLILQERVLERKISGIRYRLSDARIYQEEIQEVSHAIAKNESPNQETTVTLSYSSSESRTTSFSNSISVDAGLEVSFKTWIIPFIARGRIGLSAEVGYERQWGVEETTEVTREASYAVVVPPMTTKKVTLMATKAACDVPFYYVQRDLLTTGEWVSSVRDEGVFTGINSYNYYFQSSEVNEDAEGRIFVDGETS